MKNKKHKAITLILSLVIALTLFVPICVFADAGTILRDDDTISIIIGAPVTSAPPPTTSAPVAPKPKPKPKPKPTTSTPVSAEVSSEGAVIIKPLAPPKPVDDKKPVVSNSSVASSSEIATPEQAESTPTENDNGLTGFLSNNWWWMVGVVAVLIGSCVLILLKKRK